MIKILQYGEGNFLRAFADTYFHALNSEGGDYGVYIVKPTPSPKPEMMACFQKQSNRYHVILRGSEGGETVERIRRVECIKQVINPFAEHAAYMALAEDPELKIIISNTTEAGIRFVESDTPEDFAESAYPAKLTAFLYARFKAGLGGVYLLPVELIDGNADRLKECVERYTALWGLPRAFADWNEAENVYCNTLVDRIVSGYPANEDTLLHLEGLIGETDGLLTVGEPFGLWVIENKGRIADYVREGAHDIEVILTNDIAYYKKRKVRILNGCHTTMVPVGLMLGAETVYDCMTDSRLSAFMEAALEEIIPYVSEDTAATREFADRVKDRFLNPFLNHRLQSISLNSISKWRARVLPSFKDHYADKGMLPPHLTVGFAYLMALYSGVTMTDGGFVTEIGDKTIRLSDDPRYLAYFAEGRPLGEIMADAEMWGEDLTAYPDFLNTVTAHIERIRRGDDLL